MPRHFMPGKKGPLQAVPCGICAALFFVVEHQPEIVKYLTEIFVGMSSRVVIEALAVLRAFARQMLLYHAHRVEPARTQSVCGHVVRFAEKPVNFIAYLARTSACMMLFALLILAASFIPR